MPRGKKKVQEQTATSADKPVNGAGKALSKTDAVKQALATLGKKAKLAEIRDYAKSQYGLDISISHISKLKSPLKKQKKKKAEAEVAASNGQPEAEIATLTKAPAKVKAGIALADIEAAKELTQRVGAANLHALIGLFS